MSNYAQPDVLVSIPWLVEHLKDSKIKIIEVDVDPKQYDAGHIPGAIGFDWGKQLQDPVRRDIPSKAQLEELLGSHGVKETDTIVLYGDSSNWFAAYAFWVLKVYGHKDVKLLNGGRAKWLSDESLPFTADKTAITKATYKAQNPDTTLRAHAPEVLAIAQNVASGKKSHNLVDVRSPDEFTGKVIAPPGMNETAQRGGHIPGATSIPWGSAVNQDGTFKTYDELVGIYVKDKGLDTSRDNIAYCRIGERSSHTWFVLKYLLGLDKVVNYDGSWTEWGNLVGAAVERGAAATAKA